MQDTLKALVLPLLFNVTVTIQLDATGPSGQARTSPAPLAAQPAEPPRGCSTPVSERKTETGCYTTAETALGVLPSGSLFWHLDAYPNRAAAEAARGPRGTVIESLGRHWLFTIAEERWRPATGDRVASVGPLLVASDKPYTARHMEAVFRRAHNLSAADPVIVIQARKPGTS